MRDFFPPPPSLLTHLSSPLASFLSLHTLPNHIHEILLSFLFYHILNKTLSPLLSTFFFPKTYPHLRPRTKVSWDAHVVSFVQACVINSLALAVLLLDQERRGMDAQERLWGYTGASGMVQGFATGYFCWDLWTAVGDFDVHGFGTVVHAVCALAVSGLGFRPFANYYGVPFVLYELSTPFLNIHWFMDKLDLTGSRAQWINGVALMATFFTSRLVWGTYQCFWLFWDVWVALRGVSSSGFSSSDGGKGAGGEGGQRATEGEGAKENEQLPIPPWLALLYVISMLALSVLNIYWFGRMVRTVMSRFEGGQGKKQKRQETGEKVPAQATATEKETVDKKTKGDVDEVKDEGKEKIQENPLKEGNGEKAKD